MTVRVRIAPSPTGDPHVGTAYIALLNWCFARKNGGKFLLRIEDTDQTRCTPESERQIMESLRWLGLSYDEGPDVGGDFGPYRQSERTAAGIYTKHVQMLLDKGLAYRCFCTAQDIEAMRQAARAAGKDVIAYGRCCRDLDPDESERRAKAGESHVIRMKAPLEGDCITRDRLRRDPIVKPWADIDDQILIKSDGWPTYHLASVVDDHLMGITHVIRAEEWLNSLPKHLWLYQAFGWQAPEFVHVGLLRNADRSKISKRKNPTNLLWYRQKGYLPEALLNFLALMGHSHPEGKDIFGLDELAQIFDLDRLSVTGPVFDLTKLAHIQGQWLRAMPVERIKAEVRSALERKLDALLPAFLPRMVFGSDLLAQSDFIFAQSVNARAAELTPKGMTPADAKVILETIQKHLKDAVQEANLPWTAQSLETSINALVEAKGWKRKDIFMILRVAITGRQESPSLFDTMVLVGQLESLERLTVASGKLKGL